MQLPDAAPSFDRELPKEGWHTALATEFYSDCYDPETDTWTPKNVTKKWRGKEEEKEVVTAHVELALVQKYQEGDFAGQPMTITYFIDNLTTDKRSCFAKTMKRWMGVEQEDFDNKKFDTDCIPNRYAKVKIVHYERKDGEIRAKIEKEDYGPMEIYPPIDGHKTIALPEDFKPLSLRRAEKDNTDFNPDELGGKNAPDDDDLL